VFAVLREVLSAAGEITADSHEAEVWFGIGRARAREEKIENAVGRREDRASEGLVGMGPEASRANLQK